MDVDRNPSMCSPPPKRKRKRISESDVDMGDVMSPEEVSTPPTESYSSDEIEFFFYDSDDDPEALADMSFEDFRAYKHKREFERMFFKKDV